MDTFLNKWKIIITFGILLVFSACKKDFLEAKADKALLVPKTLSDFQALLDNNDQMNKAPYLPAIGTDDLFTSDAGFLGASITVKNTYTWAQDVYEGATQSDWRYPYQQVFYANVVLDGLEEMSEKNTPAYDNVRGSAHFFRGLAFFNLVQEFAKVYQQGSAQQDLGIPIPLSSDVNEQYSRGTLQQSYDQIIADLDLAAAILPEKAVTVYRPNQGAAYALLARVYLSMGNYAQAQKMADQCLKLNNQFLDYNLLTLNASTSSVPFPKLFPANLNPEVLFATSMVSQTFINSASTMVNSELFQQYEPNDLRKSAFFYDRGNGVITFKGRYSASTLPFAGLAIDEVLLTRAECRARLGDFDGALQDLNKLLVNRYKKGSFVEFIAGKQTDVLALVLLERRKQLLFRGTRWMDLKRLNLDVNTSFTLQRTVNGKSYTLSPGSKRYVLPIPDEEINISKIEQNIR